MPSYLDSYLAGDYQSVWDELQALDTLVPGDLLYQDALAVAHETMRRVRHNCAILLARLDTLGYSTPNYSEP